MKRKKQTLAGLRRQLSEEMTLRQGYMRDLLETRNQLRDARLHVDMVTKRLEQVVIQLARREGYIDRIHITEGREPVSGQQPIGPLSDQVILRVRDELANGTEDRAHQILDMINPSELLDRATGKTDAPPTDDAIVFERSAQYGNDGRRGWQAI